jgi:hypothetical protein
VKPKHCLERPLEATLTVIEARDAYLEENGFSIEEYDAPWTSASFFGIPLKVPNTRRHRWAIMLHDLHHVATGIGTDLAGEGEISAWEVRGKLRPLGPYVASIVATGVLLGAMLAPRRALAAYRSSGVSTPAQQARVLWELDVPYASLLSLKLGELRAMLGIPEHGLAQAPRTLHDRAPR